MLREIAGTTTRGAVGPHLPALREKPFSAPKAPPLDIEKMFIINNLDTIWPSLAAAE